ncbi:apoptosis-stimulating of p53 protein 1-like [Lampetra fluviatilis]
MTERRSRGRPLHAETARARVGMSNRGLRRSLEVKYRFRERPVVVRGKAQEMILTIFLSRDERRLTTVPVATETTCRDVLERCRGASRHGYTLTELWRGYERVVADGEKMYALLQHWGKEVADVKFYLRYDGDDPPSSPTWDTDQESRLNGVNVPSTTDRMENGVGGSGVELSLSELQEVAERQQQQIEARQQLLASKERRLQQLKQKERRRRRREEAEAGAERLRALRETLAAQEERAGRLRSTRAELHTKRRANEDLALEIERATASFQEKRRELEVAMATVTELSRQLEGLRGDGTGDGFRDDRPPSSSSAASPAEQELQRLYLDLQSKTTMNQEQSARLQEQTELLGRRTKELAALERQLQDMRGRLRSKKEEAQREGPPPHGVNGSSSEARGVVAAPPLTHPGARPTNSLPTLPSSSSSSSSHRGGADEALLGSRKDAGDKIPPVVPSKLKLAPSPSDPDRSLSTPYTHPKIPELKPSTFPPPHPLIPPPTLPTPVAPPLPPLATSKLAPPSKIFTAPSQPSQVATSVLPHPSKIPIAPSQPSQATSVSSQPSKIPTAPSQPSQVISVLPQPSKIPIAPLPATEFASSLPQPSQPQGNVVSRNGLPTLIYVTGSTRPARDAEQEPLKKPGANGAAVLVNAGASAPPSKIPLAVKVTPVPSDVASSPLSPVATTTGAITAPEPSASLSTAKASAEPSSTAPRPNPSADGHTPGKYPSVPAGLRFAGTSGGGGGGVGTLAPRPPTLKTPLVPSPGTVFSVYARPSPGSPNFRQAVHQRAVQAETTQRGHGVRPVPFPAVHVKPLVPPAKTEEAPKLSLEHPDGLALSRGGALPDRPHPAAALVSVEAAAVSPPQELLSAESFDSTVSESPPPSPLTMEEGDLNAEEEDEEEFIPNPYLTAGKADPGSAVVTATVPVLTGDEGPAEEIPDMPQSPPPPYPSSPELDIVPEIISSCGPLPPGKRTNVKKPGSERTDHAMRVKFDPFAILLDSALEGDYDLVNKIFPEVDDPSQPNDEGITALHNAVCAGHMNIVNYLLQAGVNVNAGDSDGWTPLHCAASCNNVLLCKTLVESGAAIFSTTLSDRQTAADKCELMEDGFQQCSQFMHGLQNNLGLMHRCVVYALWERHAEDEDELSFAEDDAMTVLRRGDELEDEWWWARLGEREGYIPRNFVGLFPRIKAKQRAEVP